MESRRSSAFTVSYMSEDFSVGFEDLTDKEFFEYLKEQEVNLKMLKLENLYMTKHVEKIDPKYLPVMQKGLESMTSKFQKPDDISTRSSTFSTHSSARASVGPSEMKFRRKTIGSFLKTELLMQTMEESQMEYGNFKKSSVRKLDMYKAEYEEGKISMNEIMESIELFENAVVIQGFDKLTQRIPAEKFLRYMNEWLRVAQGTTQKLLLYNNNETFLLKRLKHQLSEREVLAENIHVVDFDQLNIENKNLQTKIDSKTKHVKELKRINGWANVILSTQRYYLQSQFKDVNELKRLIKGGEEKIESLGTEAQVVEGEIEEAKGNYQKYKDLKDNYYVPDTIQYVSTKAKLYDAYKRLKIGERRRKILDIALNACVVQMKNVCKTNKVHPEWFKDSQESKTNLLGFSDISIDIVKKIKK